MIINAFKNGFFPLSKGPSSFQEQDKEKDNDKEKDRDKDKDKDKEFIPQKEKPKIL